MNSTMDAKVDAKVDAVAAVGRVISKAGCGCICKMSAVIRRRFIDLTLWFINQK